MTAAQRLAELVVNIYALPEIRVMGHTYIRRIPYTAALSLSRKLERERENDK